MTTVRLGNAGTFSALRTGSFRIFWTASVAFCLAEWMLLFGQGYLVVQLAVQDGTPHRAPLYAGLVGICMAIPGLTLGLFGGVVADRFDRRRVLLVTAMCLFVLTGTLAVLTMTGRVNVAEVLAITAFVSTVRAFDDPTRYAWMPSLVPRRYLVSAVGLYSAAYTGTQIVGPTLGGLLYVPLGIGGLFLVIAICYLVVAGTQLFLSPVRNTATPAEQETVRRERSSPLRSIVEGLRYVVRDPVLLWMFVLVAVSQFLVRPYVQLLPSFADGALHVGAVQLSWLLTASGVGAVVGAFVIASLGTLQRRGRFMILVGVVQGVALFILALQRSLPWAIGVAGVVGLAVMLFQGTMNTTLQLRTPDHLRGRVMSVLMVMPMGIMPLGISALGFVGSATGIAVSMAGAALLFGLFAVVGLVLARDLWHSLDVREPEDADERHKSEENQEVS